MTTNFLPTLSNLCEGVQHSWLSPRDPKGAGSSVFVGTGLKWKRDASDCILSVTKINIVTMGNLSSIRKPRLPRSHDSDRFIWSAMSTLYQHYPPDFKKYDEGKPVPTVCGRLDPMSTLLLQFSNTILSLSAKAAYIMANLMAIRLFLSLTKARYPYDEI